LLRRALDQPRFRTAVERELKRRRAATAPIARTDGTFVDRHGVGHALDMTHRDRLKPEWRTLADPAAAAAPPSDEAILARTRKAAKSRDEAAALLAATAGAELTGRVLEIGCYDGAVAFQIAARSGTEVIASDMAAYYIVQRPGDPADVDPRSQQAALAAVRERARSAAGVGPGAVTFIEDDITASALEPASFDVIVSFEVLEHVARPDATFAAIRRLLRPGGVGYNDYNPFFSLIGGHSLCTLDFAWGHARLDHDDFERYLRENRPDAVAQTLRFYDESLNRMTLADMRLAVDAAGLELVAVLPWSDRALTAALTPEILGEVRRTYPTATAEDLLATFVSVVVRRPA
jgi:SAM-dependent methyltransferase